MGQWAAVTSAATGKHGLSGRCCLLFDYLSQSIPIERGHGLKMIRVDPNLKRGRDGSRLEALLVGYATG